MKKYVCLFALIALLVGTTAQADTIVYFEDFDAGMGNWVGEWGIATAFFHSPPNSMADSPAGNYLDFDTVVVELNQDVDLSGFPGARIQFWTKYDIEVGFDYIYLDISSDGGSNWLPLYTFNGNIGWHLFQQDIGGYAGGTVRFKLTLESDAGWNELGMYVDDFAVVGEDIDTSPPLIVHESTTDSTFSPGDYETMATITDFSGVDFATLTYSVDNGASITIDPDSVVGADYYWTIPGQEAGAHVNYFISATDNIGNSGDTPENHYMSGWMLYFDDGEPEFVYQYAAGNKCATRFTPTEGAVLVTGMLRLYTDITTPRPLDTVEVELWESELGNPGASMITPFPVWPSATPEDPMAWTYVDLRGQSIYTEDDFFWGYTYRSEWPVILGESPAITDRSKAFLGGAWAAAGTDYEIRFVVEYAPPPDTCFECAATILTPQVADNGGLLAFDLEVTNCGAEALPVYAEMYPTIGDCNTGVQIDLNINRLMIGSLGPGETYTGHYFYNVGDVSGFGLSGCALNFDFGPAVNNWVVNCCDEFTFYHQFGLAGGSSNVGWGTEWLDREDGEFVLPEVTSLGQNYPNPFNAVTNIPYDLMEDSKVSLKIYNLSGQLVETLIDDYMRAGNHKARWDASALSSGTYFYKLTSRDNVFTKRMTLLK